MFSINAILFAAGDSSAYSGFFSAGWEYLSAQLEPMGICAERGEILSDDLPVAACMELLEQAANSHKIIVLLAAPQPRTAMLVSALVSKGLGLGLTTSTQAQQCVRAHAQQVAAPLSEEDETSFSTLPTGAVTLKNPKGYLQGYALSSRDQLLLVLPAVPSELQNTYSSYVGELIARFAEQMETTAAAQRTASPPRIAPAPVQQSAIAPPLTQRREPIPAPKNQNDTVADVCHALETAGLTIATAEAGTSGALAQILGGCQSSCYPPDAAFCNKEALDSLEISPQLLQSCGTVSSRAAAALALAARSHGNTDLGAAITAGKNGTAFLALTDGQRVWNKTIQGQNPHQLKLNAVLTLLGILNMYATGQGMPQGASAAEMMAGINHGVPTATAGGIMGRIQGMMNATRKSGRRQPTTEGSENNSMARTNLLQRLRYGNTTKNDKIRLGTVAMFLCIFVGCMLYIGSVYKESADNVTLTDGLKQIANTDKVPDSIKDKYPKDYNVRFAGLYAQNDDVAGWVKIPGTKVDYVAVQTTDNAFYERKDFTRADNNHGVPFVDFRVDQKEPSTNTVIYAHNMDDGQMFGELLNYKSLSYYQQHPLVEYDSVYHDGSYKIFGIVICRKDDPNFSYHNMIDLTDGEMKDFVTGIRERSLINTNVDVRTDDKLLTLSTCDYSFKGANGEHLARFVVFARKVRPGESADVDVSKALINPSPVMAKEWYDKLAKQQEAKLKEEAVASSSSAAAAAVNKKWLTSDEVAGLTSEEQKDLSDRREAAAKKYLTSDEIATLSLDDRLYLMDQREYQFDLFLASEEQSQSLSKRIRLADDRQGYAREWLTDEEIRAAGKWSRIEALINERKNGQGTATEKKWLTEEEIKTLSSGDRSALIADRQRQAKDAGLTTAEISAAKSWAEMERMIADKQGNATSAAIKAYIKENPKWLESGDADGRTLEALKSLVSDRKGMAAAAGIDINRYKNWSEMSRAMDEANAGNAANAAKKLISDNPKWLGQGDLGKSVNELQKLMAERQKMAKDAGIDTSKYSTWAQMLAAIQNPPPGVTSVTPPK